MCTHHLCAGQGRTVDVIGPRARMMDLTVWNLRIKSGKRLKIGGSPVDAVAPDCRFGARPGVVRFDKVDHPFRFTRESFEPRPADPARTRHRVRSHPRPEAVPMNTSASPPKGNSLSSASPSRTSLYCCCIGRRSALARTGSALAAPNLNADCRPGASPLPQA